MKLLALKANLSGADPRERAYNVLRMTLINGSHDDRPLIQRHAEGLAQWLADSGNREWAKHVPMGKCGRHDRPHRLYACLLDELMYWQARAKGATEREAMAALEAA